MQNDNKWINLSYGVATLILAWVVNQFALMAVQYLRLPNPQILEVISASALLSFLAVATFAFFYTRRPKVRTYVVEVCQELRKVTWPAGKTVYLSTIVVIVTVVVMAVVLGLFDWICARVVNLVVQA